MNSEEYINFPVSLLEGFLVDHKKAIAKICEYSETDEHEPSGEPSTGVSWETLQDFADNPKTEIDKAVLLALLAIKSIIGPKAYARTTTDFVLCRMAGHASKGAPLPKEVEQWGTRRKWERIKTELKNRYGVIFYWNHFHGFYVSTSTKISFPDLIRCAEATQERNKQVRARWMEQAIIDQTLNEIFNKRPKCTT